MAAGSSAAACFHFHGKLRIDGTQALPLLPQGKLAQEDGLFFQGKGLPLEIYEVGTRQNPFLWVRPLNAPFTSR